MNIFIGCVISYESEPIFYKPMFTNGKFIGSSPLNKPEFMVLPFEDLLDQCRSLLYDCYIVEQKWEVSYDCPTKFQIKTSKNGKKMLCDRFDYCSSWITIINTKSQVLACQRWMENGKEGLDFNSYTDVISNWATEKGINISETGRAAVKKNYRNGNIILILLSNVVDYVYSVDPNNYVVTTIPPGIPTYNFVLHIGGVNVPHFSFKYSEKDKYYVRVVVLETSHVYKEKNRYLSFLLLTGYSKL